MSPELFALTCAALVQIAQFALMSVPANLELGTAKTLSSRDPKDTGGPLIDQVSPRTARLFRALDNHFEALILFTIACTVVVLSEQSTLLTQICGWIFLAARIGYIPAYAFGLNPWRSLIWAVGFVATVVMLVAALV
ncbi:MAG: MAPEG family protein [Sedimentitalea sp.]